MKVVTIVALCLTHTIMAQTWNTVSSVPTPGRDDGVCFSLNSFGYVVTGFLGSYVESNRLFQYNSNSNLWVEKAPFTGIPRQYASVFTIENKAYLIGGYSESGQALKDVWRYDGLTDSWVQLNDFPGIARWHATALQIQGSGYFGMGTTEDSTLADFWKYDEELDTWHQLSNYPGGSNRSVLGFSLLNEGVFGGGFDINPITYSTSWFTYNPETESWETLSPCPAGMLAYGTAINNNYMALVCGGIDQNNVYQNACYQLDYSKTWRMIDPLPIAGLKGAKGFTLDEDFYLGTGLNNDLFRISDFYKLDISESSPKHSILFPNPSEDNFNLISEPNSIIEIYSIRGQLLQTLVTNEAGYLEINQLPVGLYLCIIMGESETEIRKIIKR